MYFNTVFAESRESVEKFSRALVPMLKRAIKDRLYKDSPLRNDFQVRPLDDGELPIFQGGPSYVIGEDCQTVMNVPNEKALAIMYETSCNPEVAYDAVVGTTIQQVFDQINTMASDSMLSEETRIHGLMKEYEGKGIFVIRVDVQVLVANDYDNRKMGFSVFENVGVIKIGEKK